jgi:hypothetical protein
MSLAAVRCAALGFCLLGLVCVAPRADAAETSSGQLTQKESFMLMFGKGNGAMRVLCALERDGVITPEQRRRYAEALLEAIVQAGDSEEDRRNARIGMAFADGRSGVCAKPVLPR